MSDEPEQTDEPTGLGRRAADAVGRRIHDAVEREPQADGDTPGDGDGDTPDEPQQDAATVALQEAHRAYVSAVAEALGPEAEIQPCGHCAGMGFNAIEFPPDTRRRACPDCHGWGYVETGSRVEGQQRLSCLTCNGNGWVNVVRAPESSGLATSVPVLPTFVPPLPEQPAAGADAVGVNAAAGAPQP